MNKCCLYFVFTCAIVSAPLAAETTMFVADLNSGNVITAGVVGTPSTATGTGTFVLTQTNDPAETTLSYFLELNGVDLDGSTGNVLDDVSAIHLHDTNECSPVSPNCRLGDTALTQHVLNIFGAPRQDDADLVVDPAALTVSGLWDVGDTNLTFPPTRDISDPAILDVLFSGKMFLNIHTNEVGSGAFGGFLQRVPEPSGWFAAGRAALPALLGCGRRRP